MRAAAPRNGRPRPSAVGAPELAAPQRVDASRRELGRGVENGGGQYHVASEDRDALHGTVLLEDRNAVYDDQYRPVMAVHDIPLTTSRAVGEVHHAPRSQGHAVATQGLVVGGGY